MDKARLQENFLRNLARIDSSAVEKAISEKIEAITEQLASASQYEHLEQQLEQLVEIGFRDADKTVQIIEHFLDRIDGLELTYDADHQESAYYIQKFATKERLIAKALDILDRIRYFEITKIAEIFAQYLSNPDNEISKKAIEGLDHLAKFDIDIYYAGENRAGLGPAPQLEIMNWLEARSEKDLQRNFAAAAQLCEGLLSSEMSGTSSDYRTVTWSTAAIPATAEIRDLRERSLVLLKKLYGRASTIEEKASVINAMLNSTRAPHVKHGDDVVQMIATNTVEVLNFLKQLVHGEDLQIVQKIEHETFWRFYHAPTDDVKASALEARDLLKAHAEYEIYRNLIGFEGVFEDWEQRLLDKHDFAAEKEYRTSKANEYADEVTKENWEEWKARILRFCGTESNDLATFPHFYEFLNRLAMKSPDFALELLKNHPEEISPFVIPLFRGLWKGSRKEEFRAQVLEWIGDDQWLAAIAKVFLWEEVDDKEILEILTAKAIRESLHDVLVILVSVATARYADGREGVVKGVFQPAVEKLTTLGSADWVFNTWHHRDRKSLFANLDEGGRETVLKNLVLAKKIDYHVEELLAPFVVADPARVLKLFRDRQDFEEKAKEHGDYDAIPYRFHRLNETLAQFPDIAVDTVRSWFDGKDPLFQYRGANLLQNIFPSFPDELSLRLVTLVRSHDKGNVEFVLSVLHNYEGESALYDTCREILLAFPHDEDVRKRVYVVLLSTGVVSGEFGMAEAYEQKIEQVKPWLTDANEPVRKFASEFTESLKGQAEQERRRAEEDIELRKHRYGVRDKPEASDGDGPS